MKKFEEYTAFRTNKQFIQSDALRKELEGVGYEVRDGAEGSSLVKKFF
jgi:cysteinyl-tRNA synthetase